MADMIPFFPRTAAAQAAIISALDSFVSTVDELNWLTNTAINHMREWSSLAELRGLFCTRYKPRDGRQEYSSLPGFTAADSEAAYHERIAQEAAANIDRWKKEKLLAPPGKFEGFPIPSTGLKLLPPASDPPKSIREIEADLTARRGPKRTRAEIELATQELIARIEAEKKKA
jgi:hypothetical protein